MFEIKILTDLVSLAGGSASALKTGAEAFRTLKNKDPKADSDEIHALASEMARELFEARTTVLEIQNKLLELKREMEEQDRFEETLAKYESHRLKNGGKVYKLRERDVSGHFFEFVCPTCVTAERLFIPLQGGEDHFDLMCPKCNSRYPNVTWGDQD